MRNYDVYGRLAAMEIFSRGESEARSRMGAWQDSVSPCLRVRKRCQAGGVMVKEIYLLAFGIIGIPLGSAVAVLGILICVDAFIPKSQPVSLMALGVELVLGGIILLVGVLLFLVARAALERSRLIHIRLCSECRMDARGRRVPVNKT